MLQRHFHQAATYWQVTGQDKFGYPTFGAATALEVRWENRTEKFIDAQGVEVVSRAVVYVQQDLDIDCYLFEGTSVAADPTKVEGAQQIRQFLDTPNLRNLTTERKAML